MWHAWERIDFGRKVQRKETTRKTKKYVGRQWILGRLVGCVEWIQLAQYRDWWLVLVNTVMTLWVADLVSLFVDMNLKVVGRNILLSYLHT
jgi:hypothetical protein